MYINFNPVKTNCSAQNQIYGAKSNNVSFGNVVDANSLQSNDEVVRAFQKSVETNNVNGLRAVLEGRFENLQSILWSNPFRPAKAWITSINPFNPGVIGKQNYGTLSFFTGHNSFLSTISDLGFLQVQIDREPCFLTTDELRKNPGSYNWAKDIEASLNAANASALVSPQKFWVNPTLKRAEGMLQYYPKISWPPDPRMSMNQKMLSGAEGFGIIAKGTGHVFFDTNPLSHIMMPVNNGMVISTLAETAGKIIDGSPGRAPWWKFSLDTTDGKAIGYIADGETSIEKFGPDAKLDGIYNNRDGVCVVNPHLEPETHISQNCSKSTIEKIKAFIVTNPRTNDVTLYVPDGASQGAIYLNNDRTKAGNIVYGNIEFFGEFANGVSKKASALTVGIFKIPSDKLMQIWSIAMHGKKVDEKFAWDVSRGFSKNPETLDWQIREILKFVNENALLTKAIKSVR